MDLDKPADRVTAQEKAFAEDPDLWIPARDLVVRSIRDTPDVEKWSNITTDTRNFSSAMVMGLCVAIGHQVNESKRLKALGAARFSDKNT